MNTQSKSLHEFVFLHMITSKEGSTRLVTLPVGVLLPTPSALKRAWKVIMLEALTGFSQLPSHIHSSHSQGANTELCKEAIP